VFAVATVGLQSFVTRNTMNIPTASDFVLIGVPQHDVCREMLVFMCCGFPLYLSLAHQSFDHS
jgi:hypothetical protein